jgi:transcriptional regulator with XRE-family HTH domain
MGRKKVERPGDLKFTPQQIREFRKKEEVLKREIGQLAANAIERSWISTYELMEVLGYKDATSFSRWKSGERGVPVEKIALMAEALDCSITRFFPEHLHKRDWMDDLLLAVERGQRKRAMQILLDHLPEDLGSED